MRVNKSVLRITLALFIATLLLAAKERDWKQGKLVSVEMMTIPITPRRVAHRYQCVVSDGTFLYTLEYEQPLKTPVHDPVKFLIEKDRFVLLDADGQERSTRIEKRERVLLDPDR
jgi:hypothetical protein